MDFLSSTAKAKASPGDRTFLATAAKTNQPSDKVQTFTPSDVPGFVNPAGNPAVYILAADAQAGIMTGVSREEALKRSQQSAS
jgi:hypothetical protein